MQKRYLLALAIVASASTYRFCMAMLLRVPFTTRDDHIPRDFDEPPARFWQAACASEGNGRRLLAKG